MMNPREIQKGQKLIDSTSGPCEARGLARYVPGGYVVDVESDYWDGSKLLWTACVCNLSPAKEGVK